MSASVTIRNARPADLSSMVALLDSLFSVEEDFSFDGTRARTGLEMLLGSAGCCALVADAGGPGSSVVGGMCTGQLLVSTAEGGPAVLVEDVVVREDLRGLGIGKRLMNGLERWAARHGATRLQLLADKNNTPALDFYQHHGWQSTQLICLRKKDGLGASGAERN